MLLRAPAIKSQPDPVFRSVTRQKIQDIPGVTFNQWATPFSINLPNTGYLSRVYIPMRGTVSTGTGTPGGSFNGYPYLPYGMIQWIELRNNNNSGIIHVSGWGLALLNAMQERLRQPQTEAIAPYNSTNVASTFQAPIGSPGGGTGTVAASTAYNVSANWYLGIATDDAAMFGLQPLQNNALITQLWITPAPQSAVQGNITGVVPLTPNLTVRPSAEFFQVPPYSGSQPDQRFTHAIWEDTQQIQTVGSEFVYKPIPGPVYLRIILVVENNGLPVSYGNIQQVVFRHSMDNTPYRETYDQHLTRMKRAYGFTLPDGVIVYDFSLGYGIPGIVEPRDFVDTSQLTDVAIGITLNPSLVLAGTAQVRVIREFLAPMNPGA